MYSFGKYLSTARVVQGTEAPPRSRRTGCFCPSCAAHREFPGAAIQIPRAGWLATTETCPLTVLETRRCRRAVLPLGKDPSSLLRFLVAPALLGVSPHPSLSASFVKWPSSLRVLFRLLQERRPWISGPAYSTVTSS